MVSILVIGRHKDILETVLRLLNSQPDWKALGALTDQEAKNIFVQEKFDVVLIGGGVEETSEQELTQNFKAVNPSVKVIKHFGGGSGLLFNEIQEALHQTEN